MRDHLLRILHTSQWESCSDLKMLKFDVFILLHPQQPNIYMVP